jgi:predicted phosphodiesterase
MPKVYVISDLHTDYKENLSWVERHVEEDAKHSKDILIVAGDVSDDLNVLRRTLQPLASAYHKVFYTVGNHELWVRRADRAKFNSISKLQAIRDLCKQLGVHTDPMQIQGCNPPLWIVPIWSWYHADWDKEPDIPGAMPIERVMMDFHACDWPNDWPANAKENAESIALRASGDDSLAKYFDSLNEPGFSQALSEIQAQRNAKEHCPVVISFSHFLPYQQLLPEKRWLHFPNLAKACGSDYLGARVTALQPDVHVYGHTHFTQDQHVGSIRCVQWPLGYPRDQARRRDGGLGWTPLAVYNVSSTDGGPTPQKSSYWSDYYRTHQRQPHILS